MQKDKTAEINLQKTFDASHVKAIIDSLCCNLCERVKCKKDCFVKKNFSPDCSSR